MLTAATARALADVAARVQDVLHAYDPGYLPLFDDARTAQRVVRSEDPLATAAPEGAYFAVQNARGERAFIRDGAFTLVDGRLQTRSGEAVLGFPAGAKNAVPVPLNADSIDVALGRTADARIEPDGTVAYSRTTIDPRTAARSRQRVVIGTLALARFPAGTNPKRLDAERFAAPAGTAPYLGRPRADGFGSLLTGARGLGSIDIDLGLAKLQEAYLAFDALQAATIAQRGLDRGAMELVK